jgi:hypothetical protein
LLGARGFNRRIADRFDLTLECIRRHYLDQGSPLGETLSRYREFFALFESFGGYVDFFMLQDLVSADGSAVKFFTPFDDFNDSPVPTDGDAYMEYRRMSIEFVEARNPGSIYRLAADFRRGRPLPPPKSVSKSIAMFEL